MASAARTARSGSSSCATGAPNTRHHRVADELLDRAAEALELVAQAGVVGREQRPHVLGVELLGARGEADEVGEEDGDDLALLAAGESSRRERRRTGHAEPRARRILGGAVGTKHAPSVKRRLRSFYWRTEGASERRSTPLGVGRKTRRPTNRRARNALVASPAWSQSCMRDRRQSRIGSFR